ncbi:hypothetical protein Pst134EA_013778 [Puccinia striiformis f. sp. tritici]|uniref:hypothetical protein n=1 Tax=Puccinia striiformis f. sp. tritici TaxID=168172 RepID=UPI00200793F6|nr:hypothetical protein Pst134EA_013778 [Puccinia striiformis f. sp. tritici]KAH9454684.1 hypothetical protein Pst134EB_014749 [Puccinia striiformis f. sp. tritici]KAH9465922.1 hypothetical protein Pst134EA_013778 [Puccinia striiformis f. sp. tritici]
MRVKSAAVSVIGAVTECGGEILGAGRPIILQAEPQQDSCDPSAITPSAHGLKFVYGSLWVRSSGWIENEVPHLKTGPPGLVPSETHPPWLFDEERVMMKFYAQNEFNLCPKPVLNSVRILSDSVSNPTTPHKFSSTLRLAPSASVTVLDRSRDCPFDSIAISCLLFSLSSSVSYLLPLSISLSHISLPSLSTPTYTAFSFDST